jgi:hypothetical protein
MEFTGIEQVHVDSYATIIKILAKSSGFEQSIKAAIQKGSKYAPKRFTVEKVDVTGTCIARIPNDRNEWAVVFFVTVAHSAPKHENNRTVFEVFFYSDGSTVANYEKEYYQPEGSKSCPR